MTAADLDPRIVDEPEPRSGVRVPRTFAFLDLSGFTAYTAEQGDAAAVDVLAHLRDVVRRQAERHGVRVTKWLGDGVMLSSHDPERMLECCIRIRDQVTLTGTLAVRGGLCAGDVIMFEGDDYVGAAVNIAARLCSIAAPGELLAAAGTTRAAPLVLTRPRGDVRLRGTPALVELVEVLGLSVG